MMRSGALIFAAWLLSLTAITGNTSWAGIAELRVTDTKDSGSIKLQSQEVKVDVQNTSMTSEYTLTYLSKYPKESQGTFYFSLPSESFVQEFGYWIDDTYQKASVVKAKEGRVAYESQVRRGIDPALVESTAGNNFKMRVYPIFPNKPFKVRVLVTTPITKRDEKFAVDIPLAIEKVGTFSLKITGDIPASQLPEINGLSGLTLRGKSATGRTGRQFSGQYQKKNTLPPDLVTLRWKPMNQKPGTVSLRRFDEDRIRYFEARFSPQLDAVRLPAAARLVLLWDHSLSEERHHEERLTVLDHYLAKRKPEVIELHSFSMAARKISEIKDPDSKTLRAELAKIPYDGATRIDIAADHLRRVLKEPVNKSSEVMLFTNGTDSFELYDFKRLSNISGPDNTTFVVAPKTESNFFILAKIAAGLRGTLLTLGDNTDLAFTYKPWKLASLTTSKSLIEFEIPGSKVFFPGEEVVIRGQIKKDGPIKINAKFTQGEEKKKVFLKANTTKTKKEESPELARIWAKSRIDRLMTKKRANKANIADLGLRHQLLTPFTVMVVLESCEDYREFELTPPEDCIKRKRRPPQQVVSDCLDDDCGDLLVEGNEDDDDDDFEEEIGDEIDMAGAQPVSSSDNFFDEDSSEEDVAAEGNSAVSASAAFDDDLDDDLGDYYDEEDEEDLDYLNLDSKGAARTTIARMYGFESNLRTAASGGFAKLYATYLKDRKLYRNIPFFYLFTAQLMAAARQPGYADLIASNVTEIRPGESRWLTVYAFHLLEWGRPKDAIPVFKVVTELREEDPTGFRDLGYALEQFNQPIAAMNMYEKVAKGVWDSRLEQIKEVVVFDLARVAKRVLSLQNVPADVLSRANSHLAPGKKHSDKIIVTATWDTDNTNIDLIVEEPGGRKVSPWSSSRDQLGGKIFVRSEEGFGPEQYRNSAPYRGDYRILIAYEMADQSAIRDGTFVHLDIASTQNGIETKSSRTIFLKDELDIQEAFVLNYQDRLAALPPPSFQQSIAQAKALLRQGKYLDAKLLLERLGKQNNLTKEAERLFHMSRTYAGMKQYQKAEEFNQAALVYNPKLFAAHFNNACYASLAGNKQKAFHHLNLLTTALNSRGKNRRRYFVNLMAKDSDLNLIRSTSEFRNALNAISLAH